MTIATQGSKVNYQGNGVTTEFQVPFPFLEGEDIYIQKQLEDTTVVNLTYGTDYSVTGAGNASGGTVVLTTAPSASEVISVYRSVPLTQEVDYRENEIFPAETHEEALDKLTMEVQQLQEQADRAIRISRFSDADPETVVTQVERIYDSIDNVDIVADNISDINNVGNNISSVVNVSDISTQVSTVASNADNIKTIADNIDAVIKSPEYANNSKTWAEGEDTAVAELGGVHSSKGWAEKSEVHAVQANNDASKAQQYATASESSATASAQSATASAQSATLAQNWATKTDGMVDGAEYSAKHYANQSSGSATASAQSATDSATSAQSAQDAVDTVHGLIATPIGTIFQSVYVDESLNIARRLNGQLISSTKFTGFRSWLNTVQTANPSLFTTETNWQAEKTNSKLGQCGKFVVDDTAGTIRLPCVVNAQGLTDLQYLGTIKSESLPNISGSWAGVYNGDGLSGAVSGTFKDEGAKPKTAYVNDTATQSALFDIDASRSSSTYQNNAPVQQEAIQYPYYIQVATGVEETLPAIREYNINTPFFFGKSMYSDVAPDNASWLVSNGQWNAKTVYPDYYDWLVEQMNAGVDGFKGTVGYAWKSQTADIRFWTALRNPSVGCAVYGGPGIPFAGTVTAINSDGTLNFYEVSTGVAYENLVYTESENINNEGTAFGNLKFANDYDFVINTTDQTFRLPLLNGEETLPLGEITNQTLPNLSQNTDYAITYNCYVNINASANSNLRLADVTQERENWTQTVDVGYQGKSLFMPKGHTLRVYVGDGTITKFTFQKATGNGTLYFYVGDTVQDASLINAGAVLGKLANTVTIDTNQTISGSKRFTQPQEGLSIELIANTNQQQVPAVDTGRMIGLYRNETFTKGDGYTSWIQAVRRADGSTTSALSVRKFLESDVKDIINYVSADVLADGTPVAYTNTPPAGSGGNEIVTAGWFRKSGCTARTVIETYKNGGNWYRVWSDGWIEQGSMAVSINATAGVSFVINYFKPFSVGDNQMITMTPFETDTNDSGTNLTVIGREANNFTGVNVGFARNPLIISWYACGY